MKRLKLFIIGSCLTTLLIAQISPRQDTSHGQFFNNHKVVLDNEQKIISWITPQANAYDQFLHQRWNFIKTRVPNSPDLLPGHPIPSITFIAPSKKVMVCWCLIHG